MEGKEPYRYVAYSVGGSWRVSLLNPQDEIGGEQTIAIGPGVDEDKARSIAGILNGQPTTTAEELVKQFMAVMEEAKRAADRSVLDGTITCRTCAGLVLEQHQDRHERWHEDGRAAWL